MTSLRNAPTSNNARANSSARRVDDVLVACPDARPPAYQAVVGFARAGMLGTFLTGYYDRGPGVLRRLGRTFAPQMSDRWERTAGRRRHPEIPLDRVEVTYAFDLALRVESGLSKRSQGGKRAVGRWRTDWFDRTLACRLRRQRPSAALIFSDVGSEHALPGCQSLGIPAILSMVHGDVREEREVLERERDRSPDVFPLYLGDAALDLEELNWLHQRRLRDIALADVVLVPSEHIAGELVRHGTPQDRVRVIPYAADTDRFRPLPGKRHDPEACTFLFTGGISQRKGIKYLLEAWQRIRRPGWRLQLLGAPPRDLGPLEPWLDGIELLGRVAHAEVAQVMAAADVFVFPSLFEGSAVVTYEALACGLPSIVTEAAGSVVREGMEGFVVPSAGVEQLAEAMERLGMDADLRAEFAASARARAEAFDWTRYHAALLNVFEGVLGCESGPEGKPGDD